MPIPVACPRCGFTGQAPDQAEGRTIKCRKCGGGFQVSRPAQAADPFAFDNQANEPSDQQYGGRAQQGQPAYKKANARRASFVTLCVLLSLCTCPLMPVTCVSISGANAMRGHERRERGEVDVLPTHPSRVETRQEHIKAQERLAGQLKPFGLNATVCTTVAVVSYLALLLGSIANLLFSALSVRHSGMAVFTMMVGVLGVLASLICGGVALLSPI
ncbi:MAG: hypothetical protein JNM56_22420 [Planctomycetia bacterium]|nr:hypothetical protein [Planctomycetia bacterium]